MHFIGSQGPEDEENLGENKEKDSKLSSKRAVELAESLGMITDVELFECHKQLNDSIDSECYDLDQMK